MKITPPQGQLYAARLLKIERHDGNYTFFGFGSVERVHCGLWSLAGAVREAMALAAEHGETLADEAVVLVYRHNTLVGHETVTLNLEELDAAEVTE